MIRRVLFLCLAVGALLSAPSFARAQERMPAVTPEELAPGFIACLDKADNDQAMSECYGAAAEYWDEMLNANFKKALDGCVDSLDEKVCRDNLREAQRQWMRYRDAMIPVIWPKDGGTLQHVEANAFVAEETKKQALLLGRLSE